MPYRFAVDRHDYSDYATGRVFYSLPGHPAFPVRLASEILQRCLTIRYRQGQMNPITLYDPCCGGAYHLCTLAYLHWQAIDTIIASDIDAKMLSLAERNLSLLTIAGINRRIDEIETMITQYGKQSHREALTSAQHFKGQLSEHTSRHQINTHLFAADATESRSLSNMPGNGLVDVVISDVPYGLRSSWQGAQTTSTSSENPLWRMLQELLPILSSTSVVAIAADKSQKCVHPSYQRLERFQIGKRQIVLLQVK